MTYTPRHTITDATIITASAHSAITATDIRLRYGDHVALENVSLDVGRGELVAVTGPSGAGKTSLLLALAGVLPNREGRVIVDNEAVTDADVGRRLGIVVIPQGNGLVRMLTALENVALPLLSARVPRIEARARAVAAMAELGVDEAGDQLVEELSGGQQQRIAIARGLAQPRTVLLADEPTSELDSGNRAVVMRLLREQSDRGAAVVVATHDQSAADLCDAELGLHEGHGRWIRDDRVLRA